ncbi:hypothetical protein PN594_19235, partial [Parabacteroides merdae]|nr:hypothetical protein [Parabacteroides merdae]
MEDAKKELEKFKNELSKIEDIVANKDKLEGQNSEAKVNIKELGEILEDANNITSDEGKYITGNNVVSESTNGYIQDIKLYGKTMLNTCSNDYTKTNIGIYYHTINSNLVKTGDIITIKIFNNTGISGIEWGLYGMPIGGSNSVPIVGYNKNFGKHVITLPSGYEFYRVYVRQYDGTQYVDFDTSKIKACIVKGNVEIGSFFEGIASVGNGNEIEVLSRKENGNLINKEEFLKSLIDMNPSYSEVVIKDNRNCWHPIHYGLFNSDYKLDLGFEENTQYILKFDYLYKANDNMKGLYFRVMYTDGTYGYPVWGVMNAWSTAKLTTDPNKTVSNICATYGASYAESWIDLDSIVMATAKCYNDKLENKQDKKTILFKDTDNKWKPITNLPGYWENGKFIWGDTIEQHSDGKYYYHKRGYNFILNGSEAWGDNGTPRDGCSTFYIRGFSGI